MPAKNWRGKRHPGLIWRVLFGNNGPTKGELKKLLGLTFSRTFVLDQRDPKTGRVVKKTMRVDADGRVVEAKAPAKKKQAPTKTTTGKRTSSKPSKPSATSRTPKGGAAPRRTAAAPSTVRRAKPVPLADRVLRNPDGTLNGSRKDPVAKAQREQAKQVAAAQRAYRQASKNADTAGRRAEELLGWRTPRR